MGRITRSHHADLVFVAVLTVFLMFLFFLSRNSLGADPAPAMPPILLEGEGVNQFGSVTGESRPQVPLYTDGAGKEPSFDGKSLRLFGEDGQPAEITLQALPESGREGYAQYEGTERPDAESFVGLVLRFSFGAAGKDEKEPVVNSCENC